jgi:dTDP-4-amino-4,6-dideoxygalactose transaminase
VGYNYRLSNILAALGRAQLSRLDSMIERRRRLRARYEELFAEVPGVTLFGREDDAEDNFWLTSVLVDARATGWSSGELAEWLAADDIESRPLWKPMHLQPAFSHFPATLSGASQYLFETGLTLPSGSVLTEIDIERVISRISAFMSR